MAEFHLAQLNVAQLQAPLDSPQLSEFVANLERINDLAERSPGYVWRLQTDDGDATALRPFGDDMLVNLSVWQDIDALFGFVYQSAHTEIMRRRGQWFDRMTEMHMVLWWVAAGHQPDEQEAWNRLQLLRRDGPGQQAFTFKQRFDPPGSVAA